MKTIFTLILLAFASISFSQTENEIYIDLKNNQLMVEKGDTSTLQLPFTLRFKEQSFNLKKLKWKSGTIVIPGTTKTFGKDIEIASGDNGYYKIQFELNEGKVVADVLGETRLPDNSFTIDVQGKLLTINYSRTNSNEDNRNSQNRENNEEYTAGYIYYDAMALTSKNIPDSTKFNIFTTYGYKGDQNNPYLKPFHDKLSGAHVLPTDVVPFIPDIGNTDITYFAEGMARFLAERTKDELNEAFFNKMKKQLNAYPELKTVFPKTTTILNAIDSYSYASILQVLKEAFETDIQNLPLNFYEIKNLKTKECDCIEDKKQKSACIARIDTLNYFFNNTKNGLWTGLAMFTVSKAYYTTNPADLFNEISENSVELDSLKSLKVAKSNIIDHNLIGAIQLSNLLSQSLISKDEDRIWITSKELTQLVNNKDAFNIYLGLLLAKEQMKNNLNNKIVFYNAISEPKYLDKLLISKKGNIEDLEKLIRQTHDVLNYVNKASNEIVTSIDNNQQANPRSLYIYYNALSSTIKSIVKNPMLEALTDKNLYESYLKAEAYLTPALDLTYHIYSKSYFSAIYDASLILSSLDSLSYNYKKKASKNRTLKGEFNTLTKSFVKYGTLVSTVAMAESSDEVKQAIESSVLPVGSSSIKRNANWNFSINSYVGAFWTYDAIEDYPTIGLSAPIGFNISKGIRCKNKNFGSLSLNLQAIDLGALVNYYLIEGDTASLPNDFNVKLSNVFAPGFNLAYNVPSTPITLAWGGQYIPTIYKYEIIEGVNELVPTNTFRWQASLLIDIPLFNLKVWDYKK